MTGLPIPIEWCELPEPDIVLVHHHRAGTFALVDRRVPRTDVLLEYLARELDIQQHLPTVGGDTTGGDGAATRAAIAARTTRRTRAGQSATPGAAPHLTLLDTPPTQLDPTPTSPRTATVTETEPNDVPVIDLMTDRAHSARIYDYLLGGKDHYAADRDAGEALVATYPSLRHTARVQRGFMQRTALAAVDAGIDQFLDIGTGLPTKPNLHQVVQEVRPAARVVYVDNDPIVLAHASALMAGLNPGSVSYVHADARDPATILAAPNLLRSIDLGRPIAVSIIGILHFLDDRAAGELIRTVMGSAAPGSHLAITQGTWDMDDTGDIRRTSEIYSSSGVTAYQRTYQQVGDLLAELEILEPGIVTAPEWRPEPSRFGDVQPDRVLWAAVARKP